MFAGFQPCEVVFKREDLAITSVTAGTGGAKINHAGYLTGSLVIGDTIYLYGEGVNYTYNGSYQILNIVAGEITVTAPYIEEGTGGYINYLKNYYVELQCVNPALPDVNLLPFSLQSDGDAAGNIIIDVSIVNELNKQRGAITTGFISESVTEFEIKYREVYQGSSNIFTLADNKLFIMLYALETPIEDTILNEFDMPEIYLGYPAGIVAALLAKPTSSTCEMTYKELGINGNQLATGTLGVQDADVSGYLMWEWEAGASVQAETRYIDFDFKVNGIFDYDENDYDEDDYVVN
jgi:hypothetical protein